jgi:hypothetical protein
MSLFLLRTEIFLFFTAFRPVLGHIHSIQWVPELFPQMESGQGVKLMTHLHLVVPSLRMHAAIPPLPHMFL